MLVMLVDMKAAPRADGGPHYRAAMVNAGLTAGLDRSRNQQRAASPPPLVIDVIPRCAQRRPASSGFRVRSFTRAPEMTRSHYSAASRTSGAAARTSGSTLASNLAKFFWNIATSARAVLSNSSLSFQVLTGLRISLGTPGSAVGTAKPKYSSVRNSTLRRDPSSAAVSSARVTLIGMREPVPNLPPVQPVLTSQQSTSCSAISSRSMLP